MNKSINVGTVVINDIYLINLLTMFENGKKDNNRHIEL